MAEDGLCRQPLGIGQWFAHTPDRGKTACAKTPHSDASSKPQSLHHRRQEGVTHTLGRVVPPRYLCIGTIRCDVMSSTMRCDVMMM